MTIPFQPRFPTLNKSFFLKKRFLPVYLLTILLIGMTGIHSLLTSKLDSILTEQKATLTQLHYRLTFQKSPTHKWHLIPTQTLTNVTVMATSPDQPIQKWHTEKLAISYSLFHPFHTLITLQGSQTFCTVFLPHPCTQVYGTPIQFLIPFNHPIIVTFLTQSLFFPIQISHNHPKFIRMTSLKGKLSWNPHAQGAYSPRFITITIGDLDFPLYDKRQSIDTIHLKVAFFPIHEQDHDSYKLLIHEISGNWQGLLLTLGGKLYGFSPPHSTPTGTLNLHLDGIRHTLQNQIHQLNCCTRLQIRLERIQYPDHMDIPFSINQGTVYLGNIPLNSLPSYLNQHTDPYIK